MFFVKRAAFFWGRIPTFSNAYQAFISSLRGFMAVSLPLSVFSVVLFFRRGRPKGGPDASPWGTPPGGACYYAPFLWMSFVFRVPPPPAPPQSYCLCTPAGDEVGYPPRHLRLSIARSSSCMSGPQRRSVEIFVVRTASSCSSGRAYLSYTVCVPRLYFFS